MNPSYLSPPNPQLIGRNDLPNQEELKEIRSILAIAKPRLEWLDEEYTRLSSELRQTHLHVGVGPNITFFRSSADAQEKKGVISRIYLERRATRTFVEQHEQIIAPIKRLPPELLSIIFVLSLPLRDKWVLHNWVYANPARRATLLCPYMFPTVLSSVCMHWRQVAHLTPALWADIVQDPMPRLTPETAREWIDGFTKDYPLTFRWELLDNHKRDREDDTAFSLLKDYIRRWRFLSIDQETGGMHNIRRFALDDGDEASSLTRVELRLSEGNFRWAFNTIVSRAPILQRLVVQCTSPTYHTVLQNFHSRQLTHLTLFYEIPPAPALKLLQQLPSLTNMYLSLHGMDALDEASSNLQDILHTSLSDLTLRAYANSRVDYFLLHARFPALTKLTLKCPASQLGDRAMETFLKRSGFKLNSLTLEPLHPASRTDRSAFVTKFISHPTIMPSLTYLKLFVHIMQPRLLDEELLEFLTLRPSNVTLPCLTELHLSGDDERQLSLRQLAATLASRFAPTIPSAPGNADAADTHVHSLRWADIDLQGLGQHERSETTYLHDLRTAGHRFSCRLVFDMIGRDVERIS